MTTGRTSAAVDRRDRSIVALLCSIFCSAVASLAQATVLGKLVYDLTGSKLDLGLIGLAEFLPSALLVFVSGALADRHDRRRLAALAISGEAVASILLCWYVSTDPTSTTPLFLLVLLFGFARAFASPASRALPADVVAPDRLPRLMARYSITWQAALIVGPVLGGFLYAVTPWLPFAVIAGLLVVAALAILSVQVRPVGAERAPAVLEVTSTISDQDVAREAAMEAAVEPVIGHAGAAQPERAGLRTAFEGLRFVRDQPVLLGAISLDLFAVLFGGAVALLPAIAKDKLGVGAVGLGWLRAAGGLGAAAMSIALAARPITRRVGRVLLLVVAAFGVFTIVLGLTKSFVVAFVAMAALSAADAVSVFIRSTLVPLVTPQDKRGRVLAVEMVFIGASNELGAFESGVTGQLLGTTGSVVFGGIGTLLVAAGWWRLFPALRDVDRFPETTNE